MISPPKTLESKGDIGILVKLRRTNSVASFRGSPELYFKFVGLELRC